jgi:hypothetical protein
MAARQIVTCGLVLILSCAAAAAAFNAFDLGQSVLSRITSCRPSRVFDLHASKSGVSGTVFTAAKKFPPVFKKRYPAFQLPKAAAGPGGCHIPIVAVTTTIRGASACVDQVADLMPVVVVGDAKSPRTFESNKTSVTFLSVERQHELFPELSRKLPSNHFAR